MDLYFFNRSFYQDISGTLIVAAATGDTTLVTGKANQTIYIQRIVVYITTDTAQSFSFEDSNGTPRQVAVVTTSPGDDTRWDFDFGGDGMPLNEGKNFLLNVSAAGLAANIAWEGYMKLTAVAAA